MKRTVTVLADVQVEVELCKFSTEILLAELRDRNKDAIDRKLRELERKREQAEREDTCTFYIPALNSADQHPLHGIYYALKFGKQEHAVDLMRDYLADTFGVVL